MNIYKTNRPNQPGPYLRSTFLALFLLLYTISAFGHGGKTHSDNAFTSLKALQKATSLFDRLVETNKLDETWETELVAVNIATRTNDNEKEVYVSFQKARGKPNTVYIFFNSEGEYTGSNFTGE